MSKVITAEDLKVELEFIPDKANVSCQDLGYGYQLVFDKGDDEVARIFISKKVETKEPLIK